MTLTIAIFLFFAKSLLITSFDQKPSFQSKSGPSEISDFEQTLLIMKISHGSGTSKDRLAISESIKFRLIQAQKFIGRLYKLTFDELKEYLNNSFDVDRLRRQIRMTAKKYAEIVSSDYARFKSLQQLFPFTEPLKEMHEIRIKLEMAATKTPDFIAMIYKKKIYKPELLNQLKSQFVRTYKEFQLSKNIDGQTPKNTLQSLIKATLCLKLAIEPEKTISQKTEQQIGQIQETADKFFKVLSR